MKISIIILVLLALTFTIGSAAANKAVMSNSGIMTIMTDGGIQLKQIPVAGATGDYYCRDNVIIVGRNMDAHVYDISDAFHPQLLTKLECGMRYHMTSCYCIVVASGDRVAKYKLTNMRKPVKQYNCQVTGTVYDIDKYAKTVYVIKTTYGYFYGDWLNSYRPVYGVFQP